MEESLPETADLGDCDLGISADVIEHIHEPKNLIDYLKKLHCKVSNILYKSLQQLSYNLIISQDILFYNKMGAA